MTCFLCIFTKLSFFVQTFCFIVPYAYFTLCFASFSSMSTRMMSGPIFTILHHGINNSNSLPIQPIHFAGPGTISALMHPPHSSKSRSRTFPRHLQSFTLMTSFLARSQKRIYFPPVCFLGKVYASLFKIMYV